MREGPLVVKGLGKDTVGNRVDRERRAGKGRERNEEDEVGRSKGLSFVSEMLGKIHTRAPPESKALPWEAADCVISVFFIPPRTRQATEVRASGEKGGGGGGGECPEGGWTKRRRTGHRDGEMTTGGNRCSRKREIEKMLEGGRERPTRADGAGMKCLPGRNAHANGMNGGRDGSGTDLQ